MWNFVAGVAVTGVSLTVSGCGGSSGGTTPKPTTPVTATTTATTTTLTRSAPWSCQDAETALNDRYMKYDENDAESPNGVTLTFFNPGQGLESLTSFVEQLYCSETRPSDVQCFDGRADCAMSAAIINHKIYVDQGKQAPLSYYDSIGVIINQTKVEAGLAKCMYAWDGAANNRLNRKCGTGAASHNCSGTVPPQDARHTAFANICPQLGNDPGHTCTRDDNEVKGQLCKCTEDWCSSKDPGQYGPVDPPSDRQATQCFWEMPGLIYGHDTSTNHMKDALHHRLSMQTEDCDQPDPGPTSSCQDTEVIIDEQMLMHEMMKDPAKVIDAFVYVNGDANKKQAELMRDNFAEHYTMTDLPTKIPVIKMETEQSFGETGPFKCPDPADSAVGLVV